jgi:uncharacterized protein
MDDVFEAVAVAMCEELAGDATGHDIHHAWRVFALGRRIADAEGADAAVVGAAALTHDVHRVMGDGAFVPPVDSLPRVEGILRDAGFPEDRLDEVLHCVAVHEAYEFDYSAGRDAGGENPAETHEALVVQDADNLDAIGAVGIARAFAYGGAHGNLLWSEHPLPERAVDGPAAETPADEDRGDTIAHFRAKLLQLAEHTNTEAGREIAAERHAFLETFLDRFEREWHGEA